MVRLLLLLAMLCALPGGRARADAAAVTLLADVWCPYNCDPASDSPGYAIEVARAAFAASGRRVEYRVMSWTRSMAEVAAGHAAAVIGLTRREDSTFVFPREPIGISAVGFATRGESTFRYAGPSSLEGHVLGVVASYTFDGPCGAYIRDNAADRDLIQLVSGDDALVKNLNKLRAGRIDIVVDDGNVLARALADPIAGAGLRLAGTTDAAPVYIAFSPALSDSPKLAGVLDSGIARLRASGALAAILARYHLRDWK